MSKVTAVCISEHKGTKKHPVERITVKENHGIVGDAHAGSWHRPDQPFGAGERGRNAPNPV